MFKHLRIFRRHIDCDQGVDRIHKQKLQAILERLDGEWLVYTINSEGTTPLIRKTEAIEKLFPPKPLNKLRRFMGSIHHLTRYITNLAQTAAELRPLLKNTLKNAPINWKREHSTSFENIKKVVSEVTQNKHFDQHLETRIKTSQSRITRWIDRLIQFHFDIKHLLGNKMGLINYMSRNPVGLAIAPSKYDEEFVVAPIKTFINNLGVIDNVILNELANQNLAPCQLIKKRAENKRTTINT